jgi:2-acylglycerol O-acyltransferase 2
MFTMLLLLTVWPNKPWPAFAKLFEVWHEIFVFKCVVDQSSLDPAERYVFVGMPHGLIPLGLFMGGSYIQEYYPKLDNRVAVASVMFRMPVLRQFFIWLGCIPASRKGMLEALKPPGGKVSIISGGIAEIFLSSRAEEAIYLKKRRGFVRIAIDADAALVPVYAFGNTMLFDQLTTSGGLFSRLSRLFSASLTCFWGQYYLPIPYPAALTLVVGVRFRVFALGSCACEPPSSRLFRQRAWQRCARFVLLPHASSS